MRRKLVFEPGCPAAVVVTAALLLLAPAGVWAQEADRRGGARPIAGGDGAATREDLQETIEIYMIAKMKRSLNLTDEQERVVIPLVEDLNASRREMNRRRRLTMMKLRPMIDDETSPDREISQLVTQLDDADRQFRDKELKMRDQVRQALSPRQQAQFIIFMERFRQEMEERLRRIQQNEAPGAGRPRGNPPPPGWGRPRR